MDSSVPAGVTVAQPGASAPDRIVTLRGELWRRHATLQKMDLTDERYEDAADELLDLTSEFLVAEVVEAESRQQGGRRRVGPFIALFAAGLMLVAIVLGVAFHALGGWVAGWAAASLVPVTALAVTLIVRPQRAPADPGVEPKPT